MILSLLENGEEVILTRYGKPVATITGMGHAGGARVFPVGVVNAHRHAWLDITTLGHPMTKLCTICAEVTTE